MLLSKQLTAATFLALSAIPASQGQGWGSGVTENNVWGSTVDPGWGQVATRTHLGIPVQSGSGNQLASATVSGSIAPSPTESSGCYLHGDHWHCDGEESSEGDDTCVIHVGHHHGNCSPEQLASCDTTEIANYNMGLHIGAVFIVLVTSALGVLIPLISGGQHHRKNVATGEVSRTREVLNEVFFVAKHFGTGIILSTAFIHLLFHGFIMFANSCIGHLVFESASAAIALAALFVTFLLDFFGMRYINSRLARTDSENYPNSRGEKVDSPSGSVGDSGDGEALQRLEWPLAQKQTEWQVLVLEAGIIFHSIMIGVTLGASGGNGWTTLLIVIVFHQFFEGMALGARVALLNFRNKFKPWIMGAAFILITPIGIAIGIGVHNSFAQNGKAALLSVGILNSISAGILLYAAFQLLSSDFLQPSNSLSSHCCSSTNSSLRDASWKRVTVALLALVAGMICMSVLGKWA